MTAPAEETSLDRTVREVLRAGGPCEAVRAAGALPAGPRAVAALADSLAQADRPLLAAVVAGQGLACEQLLADLDLAPSGGLACACVPAAPFTRGGARVVAHASGGDHVLSGEAPVVVGAGVATEYLFVADGGAEDTTRHLYRVPAGTPGLRVDPGGDSTLGAGAHAGTVRLDGARVGAGTPVAGDASAALRRHLALTRAIAGLAHIAAAEKGLHATVARARSREMFGGRLADLQAFRHWAAESLAGVLSARSLVRDTASAAASDPGTDPDSVGAAVLRATGARIAGPVLGGCVQAWGAEGVLELARSDDGWAVVRGLAPDAAESAWLDADLAGSAPPADPSPLPDHFAAGTDAGSDPGPARALLRWAAGGGRDEARDPADTVEAIVAHAGPGAAAGVVAHCEVVRACLRAAHPEPGTWLGSLLRGAESGELVGAFALTEPGGGSDLAALTCTATPDEHGWTVDGSKSVVTNGAIADCAIVVCRTPGGADTPLMLAVDLSLSGVRRTSVSDAAWPAAHLARLEFTACRVPAGARIAGGDRARELMRATTARERAMAAVLQAASLRVHLDRWAGPDTSTEARAGAAVAAAVGRSAGRWAAHSTGAAGELAGLVAKLWTTQAVLAEFERLLDHGAGAPALARAWADARAATVAGGPSALLRDFLAHLMGL